jgi:transcriptional regulator with XRE-family HTH domain
MRFAEMLKTLREGANLTQEALAERAGLSLRTLQQWEQGRRVPRVNALPRLARALGVPLERLVEGIVHEKIEALDKPAPRPRRKPKGGK